MARSTYNQSLIWVCLSMTAAFVITIWPIPEALREVRLNFVCLLTLFWLNRHPESIGIGGAWWAGLSYDAVIGSPLGLHALSFSLLAGTLLIIYSRWRLWSTAQQSLLVALLLLIEQVITAWASQGELFFFMLINALLGALCWSLLRALSSPLAHTKFDHA